MPIGYPAAGEAAEVMAVRRFFSVPGNVNGFIPTDAFFAPTFGYYVFIRNNSADVYYSPNPIGPYLHSPVGVTASGTLCAGTEFQGRIYRARLGSTVATAVRSTDDLSAWVTDFGGRNIAGISNDANKLVLATANVAGPTNGVLFDGTTWANIYSGVAGNTLACFVTELGRIFFGYAGGILAYSDDGSAWTSVNLGSFANVNAIYADAEGTLFCALANGRIFESSDNGATWADGYPAISTLFPVSINAFSGTTEIYAWGNDGVIAKRIAPLQWEIQASPVTTTFSGSLRNSVIMGLNGAYSVSML